MAFDEQLTDIMKSLNVYYSPLMISSSIYAWKMPIFFIRYWYPVIGYPFISPYDITTSMQSVRISVPKPLAVGVEQVIVPHDRCTSFWCYNQIGVLAVVTEIERIALLASL